MDRVLRVRLPLELVEIIMRYVYDLNMRDVLFQIKYCITWVRYRNECSYIVSNNFNYYRLLEVEYIDDEEYKEFNELEWD